MYCKKCGKKINDGARFCPSCGVMITKSRPPADLTQRIIPTVNDLHACGKQPDDTVDPAIGSAIFSKQNSSKIILIAVCAVIMLGAIVTVSVIAFSHFKKSREDTDTESSSGVISGDVDNSIDWETIDSVSAGFEKTQEEYCQDGYLLPEYFADAVVAAAEYAQGLVENGTATSVNINDSGNIFVQLSCGDRYIYSPNLEGYLAGGSNGQIITYEPCEDVADGTSDKVATSLAELDGYQFEETNNYDSDEIKNIETIKRIKNASIVLFLTHGCCDGDEIYISLGESFDKEELKKLDKSQYEFGNHGICVTSAFFDKQFESGDFEDTVFYIGACQTGKKSKLADVLIKKGASVVYAPSDTCSLRYAKNMMSAIFGNMKQGLSAKDSLSEAKKECGNTDSRITGISEINDGFILEGCRIFLNPAEIKLFGDKNKCLSSAVKHTTAGTTAAATSSTNTANDASSTQKDSDLLDYLLSQGYVVRPDGDLYTCITDFDAGKRIVEPSLDSLTGIYAAKYADLDKDGVNELLAVIAEKDSSDESIDFLRIRIVVVDSNTDSEESHYKMYFLDDAIYNTVVYTHEDEGNARGFIAVDGSKIVTMSRFDYEENSIFYNVYSYLGTDVSSDRDPFSVVVSFDISTRFPDTDKSIDIHEGGATRNGYGGTPLFTVDSPVWDQTALSNDLNDFLAGNGLYVSQFPIDTATGELYSDERLRDYSVFYWFGSYNHDNGVKTITIGDNTGVY